MNCNVSSISSFWNDWRTVFERHSVNDAGGAPSVAALTPSIFLAKKSARLLAVSVVELVVGSSRHRMLLMVLHATCVCLFSDLCRPETVSLVIDQTMPVSLPTCTRHHTMGLCDDVVEQSTL